MDVTRWFDATVLPAREGVYERRAPAGPYACWDGRLWHADAATVADAARESGASERQTGSWRGLVDAPDAPCATCRGRTVVDRGVDVDSGLDLIDECPDC